MPECPPSGSVLVVVNKKLPRNDYRVRYALESTNRQVILAMPGQSDGVPDEAFCAMDFREGIGLGDVKACWRLVLYLRRHRKRLALAHFFSTKLVLLGPIVAGVAGVRSLATVTGFGRAFNEDTALSLMVRPIYRALLRLSASYADCLLFQNRGDLNQAREWFPAVGDKMQYVGSAVADMPSAEKDFGVKPLVVLMVARLLPSKGINDFIQVATELAGEGLRFVLVGPPSVGYEGTHDTVARAAARGVIEYRGELHGDDLMAVYASAHLFLFTSYGEGLPRVMLEAGMAGLCPVAYRINANEDLVTPGRGFLIGVRDTQNAVQVIRGLLNQRDRLAANAREFEAFVRSNYSMKAYRQRVDAAMEPSFTRHVRWGDSAG